MEELGLEELEELGLDELDELDAGFKTLWWKKSTKKNFSVFQVKRLGFEYELGFELLDELGFDELGREELELSMISKKSKIAQKYWKNSYFT